MIRIWNFKAGTLLVCLLTIISLTSSAQQALSDETSDLVTVLDNADAPVFDKAKACQRLAIIGDESAVPALASLLADEKLSAYARDALERIPGSASDVALRDALAQVNRELLIGVLGSVSARRDANAIDAVAKLLSSDDRPVAEAAARALGYIGTPAAAQILEKALADSEAESRPVIGNACLIAIQRLAEDGRADKALALCDMIEEADLPEHLHVAATYNAILIEGEDALPRLAEQLESDDETRFRLALQTARLVDVDASPVLLEHFKTQPPARQALLLAAIGDLGDGDPGNGASLPTVVEAAKSGDPRSPHRGRSGADPVGRREDPARAVGRGHAAKRATCRRSPLDPSGARQRRNQRGDCRSPEE